MTNKIDPIDHFVCEARHICLDSICDPLRRFHELLSLWGVSLLHIPVNLTDLPPSLWNLDLLEVWL